MEREGAEREGGRVREQKSEEGANSPFYRSQARLAVAG